MASDDECYDYYDEDEAGEDDVGGLLDEEAAPEPELRADHWAITRKSLLAAQQQDLSMVMNLVSIEPHNARALLMHHRWKMDRIHDFLERRGREGLFREAGIMVPPENNSKASPFRAAADMVSHKRPRISTCNVCFEDVSLSKVSAMDCGHCFCNDCWTEHFLASLGNGRKHIHCMEVKCPAICDDPTVRRLLSRKYPDAAKRFDGFLLDSYLENNASVKWCPSTPHCGRAIRVGVDESERYCEVECPCGVSFCFNCAAPAHSPVPCTMWDKWDAKFRGDSENLKWISLHTKSCPGCHRPIEKNGGCNHVSCICGKYLCYACGGTLDHTHKQGCNRYDENKAASYDAIRRQMLRYTHYCDRFNVHINSRKVEQGDLWPAIHKRILQLESADLVRPLLRDASWLARAHRSLLASRLVLSRSYAFAYYMFGDEVRTYPSERANLAMAKELFEDQQEQLERNAERLSKVLATESKPVLVEEDVLPVRQETVDLSNVVDSHCREMYKCIQDELLPLLVETTHIAPYRPDGPDKAKELPA